MHSGRKTTRLIKSRGFTLVELIVVISVIAILATLATLGLTRYLADGRDAQRVAKATVISEALEKYYLKHGEYPSCPALTDSPAVVTGDGGALEALDAATLVTPQAGNTENSIACTDLTSLSDSDIFAYVGDGSVDCLSGASCLTYTLKYKNEVTGQIAEIKSRNQADIDKTGSIITLTVSSTSQINATWPATANAYKYRLEWSTSSAFTSVTGSIEPSGTTGNATGLSSGTEYFFRVRAISTSGLGDWSGIASATTRLAPPTSVTAGSPATNSITINWTNSTGATSYRIQRSTTAGFESGTTGSVYDLTNGPHVYTGLSAGTQYWFRIYAINDADQSSASAIVTATTLLATPTNLVTTPTASSINFSWNAVSGAISYQAEISTNSGFTSILASYSNITSTSQNFTGLTAGSTYYLRVRAVGATASSAYASTSDTAIGKVSGVSLGTSTCGAIAVSWSALTGASTYTIRYTPSGGSTTTVTGRTGTSYNITGLTQGTSYTVTVAGVTSGGVSGDQSNSVSATVSTCPPASYSISCSNNGTSLTCTSNAICGSGATATYYWYANGSAYQQGTGLKSFTYTPGYDQKITLTVNTRCGSSAWVGSSNSGSFTRGIPAPGAPGWIQHVVSNNLNMSWYGVGCAAGYPVYHVWIVRRSTGATQWDGGYTTATTIRRSSLPVASWDSYVQAYCQGSLTSSGWGGASVGRAG